jgi:DNA-binding response OmpR family regulator
MLRISLLTNDRSDFSGLSDVISAHANCRLEWLDSVPAALTAAVDSAPDLMIIDHEVDHMSCLEVAGKIIMRNAMLNLAVVSKLDDAAFHEAAEGLGIVARIPPRAAKADFDALLKALQRVTQPL